MRRRFTELPVLYAVTTSALTVLLVLLAYAAGVLSSPELSTVDYRFTVRGRQAPPAVAVIGVDATTFADLSLRWPFPRSVHARLVDRLRADGVRAIVYDVQFTEPTTPRDDNALIRAVARERHRVVLATTEVDPAGRTNVFGGDAVLRAIGARAASANLVNDEDGVIRHMPYELDGLPTMAVTVAELATGRPVSRAAFPHNAAWIDFAGPPRTFPAYSFSRVLDGRVPARALRGRIVVVGATAPSLQDVHATSTTRRAVMSGPELQANEIATVLRGEPLSDAPGAIEVVLIVIFGLIIPFASLRLPAARTFGLAVALGLLYPIVTQLAFDAGVVLSFVYPMLALTLSTVGTLGLRYALAAVERGRIRDTFARFVPESVVDEVLDRTRDGLRLGGRRVEVTVLFSDLRGFTSFSESRDPATVIDILNRYLSVMTDTIMDNGGTLVSYMGDGIMAVFGAPIEQPDHADRALRTAREIVGRAAGELQRVALPRA